MCPPSLRFGEGAFRPRYPCLAIGGNIRRPRTGIAIRRDFSLLSKAVGNRLTRKCPRRLPRVASHYIGPGPHCAIALITKIRVPLRGGVIDIDLAPLNAPEGATFLPLPLEA